MRAKNQWGILLAAIMAFSVILTAFPLGSSSPWSPNQGPPIVVDGLVGDWTPIQPLIVDEPNDTYPWSKNAALINSQNSTVTEFDVVACDKTRDLIALYMWLDDPDWIFMRIDYQDLWYKFSYPWSNGSFTAIYFDLDQVPGSGTPDASAAGDYAFDGMGANWDFKIEGDENAWYAAIGWNTVSWNNWTQTSYPAQSDDYTDDGIHYCYNYDANCVELALNRTVVGFTGMPMEKVGLTVLTYKKGEMWGNWGGGWCRAFDPQAPGLSGENWGWDTAATGWVKPACVQGFGPTPAQAAASPPANPPPYPYPTGAVPGIYGPATGLGNGDPKMADVADLLDTVAGPGGLTPGGDEDWVRNDQVNSEAHFKVDMTVGARIDIIDAVTGQENITDYTTDDEFWVNITLCDALDIYSFACVISWDPNVLDCLQVVFPADWPVPWDIEMPGTIDHVAGTWDPGWGATYTDPPHATGVTYPGCKALLQAKFKVVADPPASAWISVTDFSMLNSMGVADLTPRKNAWFMIPIIPRPPEAKFTENREWGYANDTVFNFDASSSVQGYNGTDWIAIDNYTWSWGDGEPDETYAIPTASHIFEYPGTYTVTLTIKLVYDAELAARGWLVDTATSPDKDIIEKPVGCVIDLFTEEERFQQPLDKTYGVPHQTGRGAYRPADTYRPDEEVTLFAEVLYNDDPRQGYLVAFEVHDAQCNNVLVETAITNKMGIANISFRIPTVCPDPTAQFGKWWAIAKVSVCEVKQNDTVEFMVNWVVELQGVREKYDLAPDAFLKKKGDEGLEHMTFLIWGKNWALVPKNVTIVVNVHDADNVVIAVNKFTIRVEPAHLDEDKSKTWQKCKWTWIPEPFMIWKYCMKIPQWTYPGVCTVKVGAYYELPIDTGVPYCPMVTDTFSIKAV